MDGKEESEHRFRILIKKNYKGEIGGEFSVKADTIEELKKRLNEVRPIFKEELKDVE